MSELKNKFGNNVSWLLIDVAEQIKCELEDSDTIETGFEIYGETEDGRETQCEVGLVDLLESASVAINDAESEITAITKQRDELADMLNLALDAACQPYACGEDFCDQVSALLSTINEQKGSN
ncbi:hypothetical protein VCSRO111_0634 [Vibrio cholerae]|uniref:hypothetical protein n=1 Tax=Vibrio cholerae TaxID=666 RepID=UPI0011D481A3|nr:hypothetical protein [Vibrio cholerae]TXY57662.1 hypothetical protein FXE91_10920 [Vibrio cholerae]GHX89629.1 hypothetical protein VCSRO111_0634 [Vibrio cholerae]